MFHENLFINYPNDFFVKGKLSDGDHPNECLIFQDGIAFWLQPHQLAIIITTIRLTDEDIEQLSSQIIPLMRQESLEESQMDAEQLLRKYRNRSFEQVIADGSLSLLSHHLQKGYGEIYLDFAQQRKTFTRHHIQKLSMKCYSLEATFFNKIAVTHCNAPTYINQRIKFLKLTQKNLEQLLKINIQDSNTWDLDIYLKLWVSKSNYLL